MKGLAERFALRRFQKRPGGAGLRAACSRRAQVFPVQAEPGCADLPSLKHTTTTTIAAPTQYLLSLFLRRQLARTVTIR